MQVIHGLSIPLGKLGFYLPRTISQAFSSDRDEPEPFHIRNHAREASHEFEQGLRHRPVTDNPQSLTNPPPRRVYPIGRSTIRPNDSNSTSQTRVSSQAPAPLSTAPTTMTTPQGPSQTASPTAQSSQEAIEMVPGTGPTQPAQVIQRTIRFPDEQSSAPTA